MLFLGLPPTVDIQTIRPGRDFSSAVRRAATICRISGYPGAGPKNGGGSVAGRTFETVGHFEQIGTPNVGVHSVTMEGVTCLSRFPSTTI